MTAWQAIGFVLLIVVTEVAIVSAILRRRRRVSPEVQAQREALAAHVEAYLDEIRDR